MFTCIVRELATPPRKLTPVPEANIFISGNLGRYVSVAKPASTRGRGACLLRRAARSLTCGSSHLTQQRLVVNANLRHIAMRDSRGTRIALGGSGFLPVFIDRLIAAGFSGSGGLCRPWNTQSCDKRRGRIVSDPLQDACLCISGPSLYAAAPLYPWHVCLSCLLRADVFLKSAGLLMFRLQHSFPYSPSRCTNRERVDRK